MCDINKLYCLILAGGKGRRLWPESRVEKPKQFIDFFGCGRTQLQQTYDRFAKFMPQDHIFVSTVGQYEHFVREQLPELPQENVFVESVWRNTGPSVAWSAHLIYERIKCDAAMIVAPADHEVKNDEAFRHDILRGGDFVLKNDALLTMGIMPTRPETGYGYIQIGDEQVDDIYEVKCYTEKPDKEFAEMFIQSGEFCWNTGIYMTSLRGIHEAATVYLDSLDYNDFSTFPNISMERGLLEKAQKISIMKCHFGWADLGTWHAMFDAEEKDECRNVILDSEVITENSYGNIIKIPKGHLAVINGLENYIVVEQDNMLLICPRENTSALIRKYSAEAELKKPLPRPLP